MEDEVIRSLYTKHGRDRAALTATVTTFRARSSIRDVGKALGYPRCRICRMHPAVRIKLHVIAGLREATATRIVAARAIKPFDSSEDLARRADVEVHR